jgi:hypothetical protein
MGLSPTARSLATLRKEGWTAQVVEKFNPGARVRQDLFGCIDIVAIRPDRPGVLGIQACVTGDQAKRFCKVQSEPRIVTWKAAGNGMEVWGWSKKGPRGKRKTWQLTRTPA